MPVQEPWQATITRSIRNLTRATNRNSKELARHSEVIDTLNGGVDAIKTLKAIVPQLQVLAEHSERIIALAEVKAEDEAFWRGLKKRIVPVRPFAIALWLILLASISGLAVKLFIQ